MNRKNKLNRHVETPPEKRIRILKQMRRDLHSEDFLGTCFEEEVLEQDMALGEAIEILEKQMEERKQDE